MVKIPLVDKIEYQRCKSICNKYERIRRKQKAGTKLSSKVKKHIKL
jgi:hypothetical protein